MQAVEAQIQTVLEEANDIASQINGQFGTNVQFAVQAGVLRFGLPFLPQRRSQWFCSEACAAALGLPHAHKFTPQSLADHIANA